VTPATERLSERERTLILAILATLTAIRSRSPAADSDDVLSVAARVTIRLRLARAYPAGNGENLGATCSRSQVCEDGVNAPILCGAGGKVELAQDVTDVRFDRSRRQPEARCDAAVGETFGYQAEDFALPLG
jgi:hypothetical protein